MSYLVGENIRLVKFTDRFITPRYIEWLNDHDVNRYMLTGRIPVSAAEIKDLNNYCNIVFAIMSKIYYDPDQGGLIKGDDFTEYIGTVFINGIDWINRHAEIGYMIGNKNYWGAGIATESVKLVSDYTLNRLNLHKIEAGVISDNVASIKVLEKNGFKEYGIVPQDYWLEGIYYDVHRFFKLQG